MNKQIAGVLMVMGLLFVPIAPLAAQVEPPNPVISNFQVEVVTLTSFVLSWNTDIGTDAEVRAASDPATLEQTQWGRVHTYDPSAVSHRQVYFGLTPNTTYYYQVRNSVPGGGSATHSGSVTTTPPPTIGSFHVEVVTQTSYVLNWTTNVGTDAETRSATSLDALEQTPWGRVDSYSPNLTYHRQVYFGLTPGTRYYYQVRSSTPGGGSVTRSGEVTTLTSGSVHDGQEVQVRLLNIRVLPPSEVRLTWNTDREAVWQVGYSSAADGNVVHWQPAGSYFSPYPNHTASITNLQPNTDYTIRMRVVSQGQWSQIDNGAMAVNTGVLSMAVSDPSVTSIGEHGATVTWTSNYPGYDQVFYADRQWTMNDFGAPYLIGAANQPPELGIQHSVNLVGLQPNTTYYYRVRSWDSSGSVTGDSGYSALYSFTTSGPEASQIVISGIEVIGLTHHSAVVKWTTNIPADTAVAYHTAEFPADEFGPLGVIAVGDPEQTLRTTHTQNLDNLQPSTRYYYRVRSTTLANRAPYGELRSFTTRATPGQNDANETPRERELREKIARLQLRISELELQVVDLEKRLLGKIDSSLTNRLKGKILLQVEENGEAWYVDPVTGKKFFLKDGQSAYDFLRLFGLGIKTNDLRKLPIGVEADSVGQDSDSDGLGDQLEEAIGTNVNTADSDNDGYSDYQEVISSFNPNGNGALPINQSLTQKLNGKILLQVEDKGQAWYVVGGKRYYLKDGQAAYELMRKKSLGITNSDLRKIDVGTLQ